MTILSKENNYKKQIRRINVTNDITHRKKLKMTLNFIKKREKIHNLIVGKKLLKTFFGEQINQN